MDKISGGGNWGMRPMGIDGATEATGPTGANGANEPGLQVALKVVVFDVAGLHPEQTKPLPNPSPQGGLR